MTFFIHETERGAEAMRLQVRLGEAVARARREVAFAGTIPQSEYNKIRAEIDAFRREVEDATDKTRVACRILEAEGTASANARPETVAAALRAAHVEGLSTSEIRARAVEATSIAVARIEHLENLPSIKARF